MQALFIGHAYTDVTFITDHVPSGDEKYVGQDFAFGCGGNSVIAAFTAAKLGVNVDLLIQESGDRLSDIILQHCAKQGIRTFTRHTSRSSLSLVLPNDDKRAILRCRDTSYLTPFPKLDMENYKAVHTDGHQPDATLYYVQEARKRGILTSLDGGTVRENTDKVLEYIDIAIVSERFCEVMGLSAEGTVKYLLGKGVKIAGVTQGDKGLIFGENPCSSKGCEEEKGANFSVNGLLQHISPFLVPKEKVVDSTGAGDVFHGAYIYSYFKNPHATWAEHFRFAAAAGALAVQKMGAEACIPSLTQIEKML